MHKVKMLFSETAGNAIFSGTMSNHRFSFLLSELSFDDADTRNDRWKSDRFAAARELTVLFNETTKRVLCFSLLMKHFMHQIGFRNSIQPSLPNMGCCTNHWMTRPYRLRIKSCRMLVNPTMGMPIRSIKGQNKWIVCIHPFRQRDGFYPKI